MGPGLAHSIMLGCPLMVRMAIMLLFWLGGHWEHWLGDRSIRMECWLALNGIRDTIALLKGWRLGDVA